MHSQGLAPKKEYPHQGVHYFEHLGLTVHGMSECHARAPDTSITLLKHLPVSVCKDPKQLFDCRDFLEICVELMWTTPFTEIKLGTENYISSQKLRPKSE